MIGLFLSLPVDGVIRRRPTQDDRSEDCGGGQVTSAIWRQPQTPGDSSLSLGGLREIERQVQRQQCGKHAPPPFLRHCDMKWLVAAALALFLAPLDPLVLPD